MSAGEQRAGFFRDHYRKTLPTSIEELEWKSPMITGLSELAAAWREGSLDHRGAARVATWYSDGRPGDVRQCHVAGAETETLVATGHLCQDHSEVIGEERRILTEHAKF